MTRSVPVFAAGALAALAALIWWLAPVDAGGAFGRLGYRSWLLVTPSVLLCAICAVVAVPPALRRLRVAFRAGARRELFAETFFSQQAVRWYDVFPDGEHFLMMQAVESETPEIVIVLNWFEELERLVPTP